jgi:hypothetical protein
VSGERFIVGEAIDGVEVRDLGAAATVPVAGVVPLSAESRHLAREFFDGPQKLGIVR